MFCVNCFFKCTSHVLTVVCFHLFITQSCLSSSSFSHLFLCSFICLRFHFLFLYRLCALSCCLIQKTSVPLSLSSLFSSTQALVFPWPASAYLNKECVLNCSGPWWRVFCQVNELLSEWEWRNADSRFSLPYI